MGERKSGMNFGPGMMKGMMEDMMGDMGGMSIGEKCMEMGERMAGAIKEAKAMTTFATEELRGLFEEWAKAVEEEILVLVAEKGTATPSEIASKLKISEESSLYLIGKMARERKLTITAAAVS